MICQSAEYQISWLFMRFPYKMLKNVKMSDGSDRCLYQFSRIWTPRTAFLPPFTGQPINKLKMRAVTILRHCVGLNKLNRTLILNPEGMKVFFVAQNQNRAYFYSFFRFPDITRSDTQEWSARSKGRYIHNSQQTQETNTHALFGIRTRDSSNQVD